MEYINKIERIVENIPDKALSSAFKDELRAFEKSVQSLFQIFALLKKENKITLTDVYLYIDSIKINVFSRLDDKTCSQVKRRLRRSYERKKSL